MLEDQEPNAVDGTQAGNPILIVAMVRIAGSDLLVAKRVARGLFPFNWAREIKLGSPVHCMTLCTDSWAKTWAGIFPVLNLKMII
jgi:hypothetical protein